MKRQLIILSGLVFLSAGLGTAAHFYQDPVVNYFFLSSLLMTISYLLFQIIISIFLVRRITDKKSRYTANKVVSIFTIVFIIFILLRIWVTDTSSLIVSYGIIAAALAFALQDVFRNFVGGILIIVSRLFRVGDRISIDDKFGDVMDIGVMNTTMMEIRGWVGGDQPSGRLLIVPNGMLINHVFYNYTRDHSFIWDEITIPLTYESNWRLAKDLVLSIITRETETMTAQAEEEIARIGEQYYLPKKVVIPSVYIMFTDNWIQLDARYVTDSSNRRIHRSRLNELILTAFEQEDSIRIASTTMTVTTIDKTPAFRRDRLEEP